MTTDTFAFVVRVKDAERGGSFSKTVEAASPYLGWLSLISRLSAAGILPEVVEIKLESRS